MENPLNPFLINSWKNQEESFSFRGFLLLIGLQQIYYRNSNVFARKIERKFGLRTVFHILARFDLCFSNSFIIHAEETEEITTVKEVSICDLNYRRNW